MRVSVLCCASLGGMGLGCNAIFGIEDPAPQIGPSLGGRGNSAGAGGGGQSGSSSGVGGDDGQSAGGVPDAGGSAGDPSEPSVTLSGTVRRYDEPDAWQGGALLTAFLGSGLRPTATSSLATGTFSLSVGAPNAPLILELQSPAGPPGLPEALLQTRLRLEASNALVRTLDPPLVSYDWLTQTVAECGAVQDSALPAQTYFSQRATLLVTIADSSGGIAGITRDQLQVTLTSNGIPQLNPHAVPRSPDDTNPPFICALEARANDAGPGERIVGGRADQTTALGRFIVFRAQNAQGTGSGEVEVSVSGYAARGVALRQSGQIGVIALGVDF